jgi:hypothetical protein
MPTPEEEAAFNADISGWMKDTLGLQTTGNFAEKDWTLVVKAHAMLETALNTVLLAELGRPELEPIIAKLETSNMATGKVAFAKALNMFLSKSSPVFIQQLSELRNFCVHDFRNFNFNIDKYIAEKPEKVGRYSRQFLKRYRQNISPLSREKD